MTLPYGLRLLCLCLACLFLIQLLLVLIASALAPVAIRLGERIKPISAARLVLALRLMPFGFGLLVVVGLCVPSYLGLEPHGIAEPVGFWCFAAAGLTVGISAAAFARAVRAIHTSRRYIREARRIGRQRCFGEHGTPAFVLDSASPYFSLAGLFRPRLVISSEVLRTLSTQQLKAALRHERAHQLSRDNLKRLLLILTPGIIPFLTGCERLERAWARFSEWAADDSATAGDPEQSLSLAEALVRLSRLGAGAASSPLIASLLADSSDLEPRIERLLSKTSRKPASTRVLWIAAACASVIVFTAVLGILSRGAMLLSVHTALEHLMH